MSNYRRIYRPGGTYFFTVNLARRGTCELTDNIDLLRAAFSRTFAEHPTYCDAIVILPDHLHAVWTLPPGDAAYSERWRKIKARFSHWVGARQRSASKWKKRETGLWQRRFWEHTVRGPGDYHACVQYCLTDPVKHGLVSSPEDWLFSSIHRDLREEDDAGKMAASA